MDNLNWVNEIESILKDANMVGIGSTRKVYKYKHYVIKTFLHPLGYKQSMNEKHMYAILHSKGIAEHIAPVLFLNEHYMVQPYYEQLPLELECTYDLDLKSDTRLTKDLVDALRILDTELDGFDFLDSGNYGLNEQGELVLIDFGMTKTLYEKEWVPLAEEGILPQIFSKVCSSCGIEKEIRLYGEKDTDIRCVACGKH